MNLSELRTESRNIFGETDASNSAISNVNLNTWANEALRFVYTKLQSIPVTERKYTTAAEVTLNSNTLSIDIAKWYKQPEDEWTELEVIDLDDLTAMDPDWENATTGVPTHLVRKGTFTALMYPPPNTANTGIAEGLKTYGMEFVTMDDDSDTPDLPLNMHDIIPHYMAYRAFSRLQDPARAGMELSIVNSLLKSQRTLTTRFSKKRTWRFSESDE